MQEQKRPEAAEQESKMNQLQAQLMPLKGADTEIDDVLRVSAKLKSQLQDAKGSRIFESSLSDQEEQNA